MLTVAQLAPIKDRDPYLYETLAKIVSAVNATSVCSNANCVALGAGIERLVRHFHRRSVERATRTFLFRRVRRYARLQFAACLFSRGLAQSLRAARQSDPLLARVFAVHRLAAVRSGKLRYAADRGRRRGRQRPRAAAVARKRRVQ